MTARAEPSFLRTVVILLDAARRRSLGRLRRNAEMRRKRGAALTGFAPAGGVFVFLVFAAIVQVAAAMDLLLALRTAERLVRHGAPPALPDLAALAIIGLWALMLACQGEVAQTDMQRVRQPMWEFLFSHPAPPAAIFLAEMLAPIAANPTFLAAPLFVWIVFGKTYGAAAGALAALLVGVPATVGLACLGKAIEINALLRLSPSTRGAVLGVLGWLGFATSIAFFVLPQSIEPIVEAVAGWLAPLGGLPMPPARILIGRTAAGAGAFWQGIAISAGLSLLLVAVAVPLALAGARGGLVGLSGGAPVAARVGKAVRFGREPLFRKELLWFRRDRRALVQAVLMPLSLAALQTFNMRAFVPAHRGWSAIAGIAVVFGTYFLLTLGPMSLASEGTALWIAQTWPRGLESLLKAKAKLWALIASVVVWMALAYTAWLFPRDSLGILAIAALWWVFARSLAEKTVTLATIPSASGEPVKVPAGRRWATTLGVFAFAIGVMTGQWTLAITGVVYSIMTATAMWENFRHRLPFLADPWSETLPPAPTLMHAMIAIAVMVEAVSILSGIAFAAVGGEVVAVRAVFYGVCGIVVAVVLCVFLQRRGVAQRDIWLWPGRATGGTVALLVAIVEAAALGAGLGCAAHLYLSLLKHWPELGKIIEAGQAQFAQSREARIAYLVMAVGFAPPAEEFLFRGLLYRALDREWGGWRAIGGTAVFFAIYHPVLAWVPVAALGALNAMLFKRSGRLAASVAAHMAYNAVVLGLAFWST